MKILVRLPNWLGDMVMAEGVMNALPKVFPGAAISVIVKKGLQDLVPFMGEIASVYVFDKEKNKGIKGAWTFGKEIKNKEIFDLFICLPNSLSSALMAKATGAKMRLGYNNEGRSLLLTHSFNKEKGIHRVEEYIGLLEQFLGKEIREKEVLLHHHFLKKEYLILNINSEASSRRLTPDKAIEIINHLRINSKERMILIGAPKEKSFVESVYHGLATTEGIENRAGSTTLLELIELLASAKLVLSTDSGPAHLANALGTFTVALFGAGNEKNTGPYNQDKRTIIRLGQLGCEPCEKNVCLRFDTPQCLERLSPMVIGEVICNELSKTNKNG